MEIPCRAEIKDITYYNTKLPKEINKVCWAYSAGYNIDAISKLFNITRERVRMYLYKAVRIYYRKKG